MNNPDLIRTVFLKTLIIDKECFSKLKKLILDGPKYLFPLIEGRDNKFFSIFFKDPEKLFHVDFSTNIFFIVDLDKHVKLPNFIDCPVKARVRNL